MVPSPEIYIFNSDGELVPLDQADELALAKYKREEEEIRLQTELAAKDARGLNEALMKAGYPYPTYDFLGDQVSEAMRTGVQNPYAKHDEGFDKTQWVDIFIEWIPKLSRPGNQWAAIDLFRDMHRSTRPRITDFLIGHFKTLIETHPDDFDWYQTKSMCSMYASRWATARHYDQIVSIIHDPRSIGSRLFWIEYLGRSKVPEAYDEIKKVSKLRVPKTGDMFDPYGDLAYGVLRALRKLKHPGSQKLARSFLTEEDRGLIKFALKTVEMIDKAEANRKSKAK